MKRYRSTIFLVALCMSGETFAASALPSFGFDNGATGGWTAGRPSARPEVKPSGGPTGDNDSFLFVTAHGANGPGSIPATFNNGPDWVGDFSTPGITGLSVDIMNEVTSSPLSMRLVLFGPGNTDNRWTSTELTSVPNDGEWRNYVFPISETDLTLVLGSSTYDQVIGDVVRIMLRQDTGTPSASGTQVSASLGIDNIALLAGLPLDCDADGLVGVSDLDCANAAGITADLLANLNLLPGDLDGMDGVAFADFLMLSGNFGTDKSKYTEGNIDGIGGVEFADFLLLSSNFGKPTGAPATVPEPCGCVLFASGLLVASLRRRRQITL